MSSQHERAQDDSGRTQVQHTDHHYHYSDDDDDDDDGSDHHTYIDDDHDGSSGDYDGGDDYDNDDDSTGEETSSYGFDQLTTRVKSLKSSMCDVIGDFQQRLAQLQQYEQRIHRKLSLLRKKHKKWRSIYETIQHQQQSSERVELNVGGEVFMTTVSTLTSVKDTVFSVIFSGQFDIERDTQGRIFFDRDGIVFRWILNFLRNRNTFELPRANPLLLSQIYAEADFFQVKPLVDKIDNLRQPDYRWTNGSRIYSCASDKWTTVLGTVLWEKSRCRLSSPSMLGCISMDRDADMIDVEHERDDTAGSNDFSVALEEQYDDVDDEDTFTAPVLSDMFDHSSDELCTGGFEWTLRLNKMRTDNSWKLIVGIASLNHTLRRAIGYCSTDGYGIGVGNGKKLHGTKAGEPFCDSFSEGDYISLKLDYDTGILSVRKNFGVWLKAFEGICGPMRIAVSSTGHCQFEIVKNSDPHA